MGMDRSLRDYDNDPHFKALVDMMASMIFKLETTPSELRSAVMLAAYQTELIRGPRPFKGEDGKWHEYTGQTYAEMKEEAQRGVMPT